MLTSAINKTVRANGRKGERMALRWLYSQESTPRVEVLNDLIDLFVDGKYVEIKTCSERITAPGAIDGRAGRFTIEASQHHYLVAADGSYLFIVLRGRQQPYIWFQKAVDVYYHRQISWTTLRKEAQP